MKKTAWLAVALAIAMSFGLAACGKKETVIESTGNSTIMENVKDGPDKLNVKQVVYAVTGKLKNLNSYKITTSGNTVAKKGFITYKQQIDNLTLKNGDESFVQAVSDSALVKMKHQAFSKETGKVAYRNAVSGDVSVTTDSGYIDIYGLMPSNPDLMGCVFNDTSILFAEKISSETNRHEFRYILDNTESTAGLRRQMKAYGSLSDYPTFDSLEVLVTVDDEYNPITSTLKAQYVISKAVIGKMDCTETLTSTYTDLNDAVSIPDTNAFNAALGTTPSDVVVTTPEKDTALEGLVGSLVEYDLSKGISVGGEMNMTAAGQALKANAEVAAKVDMAKLTGGQALDALTLDAKTAILGMPIEMHVKGGELYLRVADEKIKGKLNIGLGGDFNDFISVTSETYGYSVALGDGIKTSANALLSTFGLTLDTAKIDVTVSSGRASAAAIALTLTDSAKKPVITAGAELLIAEKAYVEPDLADYADEVRYAGVNGTLMLNLFGMNELPIDYDVNMSYDPKLLIGGADLLDVITVAADIDATGAGALLSMVGMFAPGVIPENFAGISLYLYKGDLYTVVKSVSNGELVSTTASKKALDLGGLDLSFISGIINKDTIDTIMNSISVSIKGKIATIKATQSALDSLNKIIRDALAPIKETMASFGSMLDMLTLTAITGTVKLDTKELEILIDNAMVPITFSAKIKNVRDVDKTIFVDFENKFNAEVADIAAADAVNEQIASVADYYMNSEYDSESGEYIDVPEWKHMSFGDETEDIFAVIDANYAALTETQKAKVLNYAGYQKAKADYAALRAEYQAFARTINAEYEMLNADATDDAWTTLNKKYDGEYSYDSTHDNVANTYKYLDALTADYIAVRTLREDPAAKAMVAEINSYLTAYDTADDVADWTQFGADNKRIKDKYNALCAASKNAVTNYADFTEKIEEYKEKALKFVADDAAAIQTEMTAMVAAEQRATESEIDTLFSKAEALFNMYTNMNLNGSYTVPKEYTAFKTYCTNTFCVFTEQPWIDSIKAEMKAYTDKFDKIVTEKPYTATVEDFYAYQAEYKTVYDKLNEMNSAEKSYGYEKLRYGSQVTKAAGFSGFKEKYTAYNTFFAGLVERRYGALHETTLALISADGYAFSTESAEYKNLAAALAQYETFDSKVKNDAALKAVVENLRRDAAAFEVRDLEALIAATVECDDTAFDLDAAKVLQQRLAAIRAASDIVKNDRLIKPGLDSLATGALALDLRITDADTAAIDALEGDTFVIAAAKAAQENAKALLAAYDALSDAAKADPAVKAFRDRLDASLKTLAAKISAAETPVTPAALSAQAA